MGDLSGTKALIIVFAMDGCPACMDYKPRLENQVAGFQRLGHPFVFYENGLELEPGQIPILIYDADSTDPNLVALAEQYKIEALPTTVFLTKNATRPHAQIGALTDGEIYQLLCVAIEHNR